MRTWVDMYSYVHARGEQIVWYCTWCLTITAVFQIGLKILNFYLKVELVNADNGIANSNLREYRQ